MEVYCRSNMPVSENITSFCEVESGSLECTNGDYGDHYVNDIGNHFTDLLNIQEKLKCITIPSLDDDINYSAHQEDDSKESPETIAHHEDACKDSLETGLGRLTSNTSLSKCATFPLVKDKNTDAAVVFDLEPESLNDLAAENSMLSIDGQSSISQFSRSKSLPTPLKLISAMKGSRERIGAAPPRKLSVKWAPDVYDPIPTAVSHVPNNNSRSQRHKSDKRNGKNKHKSGGGKASQRGNNKGKDKKLSRKHGGSSNRCYKPLDNLDKLACYGEPQNSAVDFDVDSPDPFCGHSFLKKSVTQLHFPVAEAT